MPMDISKTRFQTHDLYKENGIILICVPYKVNISPKIDAMPLAKANHDV